MFKEKKSILRMFLNLFLFSIVFLSLSLIAFGLELHKASETKNILFDYKIDTDVDYVVNLKENSFDFFEEDMEQNDYFISDFVTDIDVSHELDYSSSSKTPLKYTYTTYLQLTSKYKESSKLEPNSNLWNKKYPLKSETVSLGLVDTASIKDEETIDFEHYNNEISNFLKHNRLPMVSTLTYNIEYRFTSEIDKYPIVETVRKQIEIPLALSAFNISVDDSEPIEKDISEQVIIEKEIDLELIVLGLISLSASFILIILINLILIPKKAKSLFAKTRDKILRENGDIIVEVLNPIKVEGKEIIKVKDFKEMIDLQEELREPISYFEKNSKGVFWIIHEHLVYVFAI